MAKSVLTIAAAACFIAVTASAPAAPLSVRDSFRVGSGGTSFCSAQSLPTDKALTDMFDAGYSLTCRDAALPVGKIFKLRDVRQPEGRLAALRNERVTCSSPTSATVPDLGRIQMIDCRLKGGDVGYRVYQFRKGKLFYSAEGLAGYDSVLQLALRSVVADQSIKGEVSVAT